MIGSRHSFGGLRRWLTAAAIAASLGTSASAHVVPVEPTVAVRVQPAADRLTVDVVVPIAGLADAELPRTASRRLAHPEADEILRLVAREIATALSFAEGQQALEPPAASVSVADDESQVTFALTYALRPDRGPLSARLHTFPATPRPLAMVATFDPGTTAPRTFTLTGAPARIVFEPGPAMVARHFAAYAGGQLLDNRDALLMLLCLAVGIAGRANLRRAVLALTAGHVAGLLVRAGALAPLTAPSSTLAAAVAASVVVAAAAALVARSGPTGLTLLALVFGVFNGASLGEQLHLQTSFAGAHPAVAVGTALAVTTIGQIWVVAVLTTAVGLLRTRGLSEALLRYATAAWTSHTALHLIGDRTLVPEGTESALVSRLESVIVLSWIAAFVVLAAARALRGRAVSPGQP